MLNLNLTFGTIMSGVIKSVLGPVSAGEQRLILDQIDSVGLIGKCKSVMIPPKLLAFGVGEES